MGLLRSVLDLRFVSFSSHITAAQMLFVGLVGFSVAGQVSARELTSPFVDVPSIPEPIKTSSACPPPSPVIRDLSISTAYTPGDFTKIDPGRAEVRKAAVAPIHAYIGSVVRLSDEAMRSTGEIRRERQLCALRWLTAWAEQDALFGNVSSPDGAYERKWLLGAVSLAYLKMYGAELPTMPPQPVTRWMRRLIDQVMSEYPALSLSRNNHYYWAGLAVAAAAIAIDDKASYIWGQNQYDLGLSAVDADGFLPLEAARGQMALFYHAYSASALSMLGAFRSVNGQKADDPRLRKLVQMVLKGLANPTSFAERAGAKQIWHGGPDSRTLAWLEVYRWITNDVAADNWIVTFRPFGTIWLGGDTTHAFGVPGLVGHRASSPLSSP